MKAITQQIDDLRHWADMAELTAEQRSCLSPGQLREVADSLENLLSEKVNAQAAGRHVYHYSAMAGDGRSSWNGIAIIEGRITSMERLEQLKVSIGETFNTSINSIVSLSYLGREHDA